MGKISEVDALKAIDDALSGLDDSDACERVLSWAWKKFAPTSAPKTGNGSSDEDQDDENTGQRKKKSKRKTKKAKAKRKGKRGKSALTMAKDLNLKPKGKTSLDDFVNEKKPSSIYEKCTVAAYYLKHKLGMSAVTANHVFTCFKHMHWRVPADLVNSLAYTSSHYGWLDTSDRENIGVTTMGENLVEHDLPKSKAPKKK